MLLRKLFFYPAMGFSDAYEKQKLKYHDDKPGASHLMISPFLTPADNAAFNIEFLKLITMRLNS